MEVYGHPLSAPTREILVLCAELGLHYELVKVGQGDEPYLPEALNPLCKVPMLDDEGFVLAETHAIQRYLVNKVGGVEALYPADPRQRAVADQWLQWQAIRLAPQVAEFIYCSCYNPAAKDAIRRVESAKTILEQLLPELERALAEGELNTTPLSLVTIALGVSLGQLLEAGFSLTSWPQTGENLVAWLATTAFADTRSECPL